jgi:acyl-CoA dehydrogenase
MTALSFIFYLFFSLVVLYRGNKALVWEVASAIYLISNSFLVRPPLIIDIFLWLFIFIIFVLVRVEFVKRILSDFFYQRAVKSIPKLSKTEEEALNAGDTWLEKDIFTGTPDWKKLAGISTALSLEEQAFLDNETEVLCSMLNEWEIAKNQDLLPSVWTYLKEKGFFGLVIEKEYGGKGFSARAHSDVVLKIASRSGVAAVTVMVPNSLGPGELLQHYGTAEQKAYYLPRLAQGEEIPCFALTEPDAGSDATSIKSEAIVTRKKVAGQMVLGLMLKLNKRWITLAPVATLIGLAVVLKDPEGLLNGVGEEGITCLLISRDTENLEIGNRHLPANQPFMNGTIRGENIFVPLASIIGGQEKAGKGWQMLVECLSIGRSISLPALATASSMVSYLSTGAFSRIRRQFNVEIARFEGVEEKLAEIAGLTYLINATRLLTVAAVYEDKKPSVASAITKYFNTELSRKIVNAAMDIHAGRAVVTGPRNYLSNLYQGLPISITVEGANIMSRNLLIFGQGSMACHPYVRDEFYAVAQQDIATFHTLLWQHIGYFLRNFAKTVLSAWTGGCFIISPKNKLKREYQRLARLSYAFAWLADLSLIYLGGDLKRKERLSARLADGMSYLYMAMAALRSADQRKETTEDPHPKWAVAYCFYHAQQAMMAFCDNFPNRILGIVVRFLAFPWGHSMRYPSDKLSHQMAQSMTENNPFRTELKAAIYLSGDSAEPLDKVENAFGLILDNASLYEKVSDLKRFSFGSLKEKLAEKVASGHLRPEEMDVLVMVEKARWDAMLVDEFDFNAVKQGVLTSLIDGLATPLD